MYAYIELSNIARTDSIIQSLSWMNYLPLNNNQILKSHHEGWLATGNTNHLVSVTYTSIKSDENLIVPDRTNFNLRAHRTEVRIVSWNVPYQKLATVDEKGVIFVWVKHDNRWSLELINDRSHPVTDMSWSYDGRMTVICYEDGFILVGSVTGQRYWSTILNLPQAKISAVTWLPDVSHVIIGTTLGQLIIMDHHGNTIEIYSLSTQSIRQLMYSCNKFYPESPDNNATKFLNDDYILACSLENGQVLLLNNYQDQSPITIDTNLQNTHIDWSYSDEILAIGGHKRLNDMSYNNDIIFYNRRGEFLHRVHIPQTTQPLSALCWAHNNEIIFVACGSFVYTIWIIHKSLPSMLILCQMKIKENLLKNSLENFDKLSLPNNLKIQLMNLYRSTIKGFLPEQNSLRSFVCNPLKSHLRLQCTMKRIDNEKENHQSSTTTTATNNHYSGAIYVLYLEYLGGLIPLLTAKRISKLCPNFIIFDPQIKTNNLLIKSSLNKTNSLIKKNFSLLKLRSNNFQDISNIQQSSNNYNRSSLISNRNSIYVAQTNLNNNYEHLITSKTCSDWNSDDEDEDDDDTNDSQETTKGNTGKLCTIAANIWGTRFKFYGHSNHLPKMFGSVTYKTSFLHLQPRQMTVTVAENYNNHKSKQSTINKNKKSNINRPSQHQTKRIHRNSSFVNSSSPSSANLSRSISPTTFIRPISHPCIQVKEPLSRKSLIYNHHSSSSIINNTNTSTANATTTLLIDNSSGYEKDNILRTVFNLSENCFEPETYRNNSNNQLKNLSLSDPTLNQIVKKHSTITNEYFSTSSLYQSITKANDDDDDDEIENLSLHEEEEKITTNRPRRRLMTCTSGTNDSLIKLPTSNIENQNETSFYVMQNRPPLWNEQSQVYQLDFGGRVTLESAKNFQIEFQNKQVIQFGRIENNCYTLDFEWPFSPLQAFAIALANITQRLK